MWIKTNHTYPQLVKIGDAAIIRLSAYELEVVYPGKGSQVLYQTKRQRGNVQRTNEDIYSELSNVRDYVQWCLEGQRQ